MARGSSIPITPIAYPVEGSAGKTGSWRFLRPVVERDKCVRCGFCWLYCPEPAIKFDDEGYPVIIYDYCKGCGICANECPRGAIKMVREGE